MGRVVFVGQSREAPQPLTAKMDLVKQWVEEHGFRESIFSVHLWLLPGGYRLDLPKSRCEVVTSASTNHFGWFLDERNGIRGSMSTIHSKEPGAGPDCLTGRSAGSSRFEWTPMFWN